MNVSGIVKKKAIVAIYEDPSVCEKIRNGTKE